MEPTEPVEDYPAEVVTLRDGTPVTIRAIRPDDAPRLQAGVAKLSPQTAFWRFGVLLSALSDAEARRLARVDYQGNMALVATCEPQGSDELVGVARYAAGGLEQEAAAEVAIVVADDYQGRGLGTLLLRRLAAYAREHGIRTFVANISPANERVLNMVRRSGLPTESRAMGPGELQVRISLDAPHPPETQRTASAAQEGAIPPNRNQRYGVALEFAGKQLRHLIETYPDSFPMYTVGGKWLIGGEAWTNWCEGFLGGQLWLIYKHTADPYWRNQAEHYSRLIEHRKTDRSVHDLGFLFWPTWKRWYDLTGDEAINAVVIEAGRTLALRFKEKGGYLSSFVADESLFIDIMMNVGIIFYAAGQTGDANLLRVATQHCVTTRRYLVRGDGSTAHEGIFDTASGEFLRQSTHQGWRGDSSWARGQAWALYGFATTYTFTGDPRFLHTAEACADYYIERTPASGVPPNDWDEPNPALPYESSAAAIAASGLLDLARLTPDPARRARYRDYALRILDTLTGPEFLAAETPGWEGVLKHGIYHQRKGLGVDESVMWGDYFFLEALSKAHE